MQKQPLFSDADAYVASLDGWRRECVERLRASVRTQEKLQEAVKWGHLVYEANGPVLLIRAEAERVLFGFWRGQRLRGIEPALRESGRYEMATMEIREGMPVDAATARALAEAAVALNEELGDPRLAAKGRQAGRRVAAAAKRTDKTARRTKPAKASGAEEMKVSRGGNVKATRRGKASPAGKVNALRTGKKTARASSGRKKRSARRAK